MSVYYKEEPKFLDLALSSILKEQTLIPNEVVLVEDGPLNKELYEVVDKKNTHSWYTAGMFLETRAENKGLDKFFSWIENICI